jgi:hypothetical protein
MRGTRVHKQENGRYLIIHFGNLMAGLPSQELDMNEHDAFNLCGQLNEIFADRFIKHSWKEEQDG